MDEDTFNMSMRKFLKQVGVTAQQEIEKAARGAEHVPPTMTARAVITIPELGLEHLVEGEIRTEAPAGGSKETP